MKIDDFLTKWAPRQLSLTRMIVGFTFAAHGSQKLFAFPYTEGAKPVELLSFMGLTGSLELVGGLLLLIGLFTRPVAFILAGQMAVAYFMVHAPNGFWPVINKGELAVVYCWVFLYYAAAGGGPWSVDGLMRSQSGMQPESRAGG